MRADAVRNRERALAAASRVFATDPRATVEQVVAASGLARATLYRYFPDRAALVHAVVDRGLVVIAGLLADARPQDGPAVEALVRLTRAGWAAGDANAALVALVGAGQADGLTGEGGVQVDTLVRDLVQRAQQEGALRSDLPAAWIADLWFAALQSSLTHPPDRGADPADQVLSMLIHGVGVVPQPLDTPALHLQGGQRRVP